LPAENDNGKGRGDAKSCAQSNVSGGKRQPVLGQTLPVEALLDLFRFLRSEVLSDDSTMTAAVGSSIFKEIEPLLVERMRQSLPRSCKELHDAQRSLRELTKHMLLNLTELGFLPNTSTKGNDGITGINSARSKNSVQTNGAPRENDADPAGCGRGKKGIGSCLTDFVANIEEHFAHQRRCAILAEARAMIRAQAQTTGALDGGTVLVSERSEVKGLGKGSAVSSSGARRSSENSHNAKKKTEESSQSASADCFCLPECRVTVSAQGIVELAHSVLAEACDGCPPYCAGVLFRAARDVLDMFRALAPIMNGIGMHRGPSSTNSTTDTSVTKMVLFHNDCIYLAHHAMTIGHQYRDGLPEQLRPLATMVDLAPPLRALGERQLSSLLASKQTEMETLMGEFITALKNSEGRGIDSTSVDPGQVSSAMQLPRSSSKLTPEYKLQQIVALIFNVASDCAEILPRPVYVCVVGLLADTAACGLIQSILGLGIISSAQAIELEQLLGIMSYLGEKLETAKESMVVQLSKSAPNWKPLNELRSVVSESLSGVSDAWHAGKLSSLGGERTSNLVSALFPPSQECASLLDSIERN
jgi:centromere/kinetochore protein ZW10